MTTSLIILLVRFSWVTLKNCPCGYFSRLASIASFSIKRPLFQSLSECALLPVPRIPHLCSATVQKTLHHHNGRPVHIQRGRQPVAGNPVAGIPVAGNPVVGITTKLFRWKGVFANRNCGFTFEKYRQRYRLPLD
jgi:hypothetical protein